MNSLNKPVNIFWTGGWDSSFRILQLILVKNLSVQPYYIIDPGRKSLMKELDAIQKIALALKNNFPGRSELLLPVKYSAMFDIAPNKTISKSHAAIQQRQRMGIQYEWLARYCFQHQIHNMEISLELRTKQEDNILINAAGNFLLEEERAQGKIFIISEEAKGKNIHNLFGNMVFPVIDLTKKQMYDFSVKHGFSDLLEWTWFCHLPTIFGNPCGKCPPCRSVYEEGLKWRLPATARFRYHTWPALRKIAGIFGWKSKKQDTIN